MRRRAFTLIEVILAFGLLALITTTLFTTFKRQTLLKAELTRAETAVLQRKYFSERFSQIFSSLALQEPFYLDKEQSLHFVFDNGIDPERAFCHYVHGKIFFKKDKLLLEITSLDKKQKREEPLFEKVNEVAYRFISFPPKSDEMGHEFVPTSWSKKEGAPPRLLRISVIMKEDEVNYAFSLNPSSIPYRKGRTEQVRLSKKASKIGPNRFFELANSYGVSSVLQNQFCLNFQHLFEKSTCSVLPK